MRGTPSASTLVEQHDPINRRVPEAPVYRVAAAAWASMEENHGLSVGIATLLVVDGVDAVDIEKPGVVWLDFWE